MSPVVWASPVTGTNFALGSYGRIFVYTFCLINIIMLITISDDAKKMTTLNNLLKGHNSFSYL